MQANVNVLQASNQREHHHRSSRQPTDTTTPQLNASGSDVILSPASAQVKDCDRERSRGHANPGRELSMSVQLLASTSRMASHRGDRSERTGTDKDTDANGIVATHSYASATATPNPSPGR
jgi:hypothetical protein